ncbi:MAG: hypothetical protein WCO84_01540 [bacterium]
MITPSKTSCKAKMINFKKDEDKWQNGLIETIKEQFEYNPSYIQVYKNFDYTTQYKTWIQNGNKPDNIVGYKTILQYPYDTIVFSIGDYIHWDYKHSHTLSTWIIESLDSQHTFDSKGRMFECNNFIKWKVGKLTYSVPCVFMDAITTIAFREAGTDNLIEPNGTITVYAQQNSETAFVKKNKRFMFGGIAYLVKQIINSVNSNLLRIYLVEVPIVKEDDIINNIAWNGEEQTTVITSETIIEPKNITSILEGATQTFTVYKYVNGVKALDVFTYSASNIPAENYQLTSLTGNSFSVKCVKSYDKNALLLTANNTLDSTKTEKEVWMKGGWL